MTRLWPPEQLRGISRDSFTRVPRDVLERMFGAREDTRQAASSMLALGSSMFPCVPSGSTLGLRTVRASSVRVGDIVAYPSLRGGEACLVAHRVVAVEGGGASGARLQYVVRGDAQDAVECVMAAGSVLVVASVARGALRYRTGGPLGRLFARVAVQRGVMWQLGRGAAHLAVQARGRARRAAAADGGSESALMREQSCTGVLRLAASRPSFVAVSGESPRDSLLRGLKHELRTPLNAILGFADLLLGELDGPLDADERENVAVVREAGWNLLGLINEVLDLATALMMPAEPVYEESDMTALLDEVRRELEQRRGMRPVHVRVISSLEQWEPRVERRLLSRTLRALGDVALSVTTAGGVTLGVGMADERSLRLWLTADGFGADVAAAHRDPLLFALGQLRPTDRTRRVSALRIAIAQQLLERHCASLGVEAVDGVDALSVRVPLQPVSIAEPEGQGDGPEVSLALSYIAAMSHDLRTPLNAILGFAELLALDRHRSWSAAQRRSLEIVRERAVDLGALVDDMIDWAKLEAGELELTQVVQPVLPLIERAVAAATKRSGTRGLTIALHAEAGMGYVSADGPRCVQAWLGLLDHAIRSNPGPQVALRVQRTAAEMRLELVDPGLEIRPEDQTAVFDAFRPSHAPTGQRIAGLQLGPSVARSLLRAHGGDVWFESRPGHGTIFTATLPLALHTGSEQSRDASASSSSGRL